MLYENNLVFLWIILVQNTLEISKVSSIFPVFSSVKVLISTGSSGAVMIFQVVIMFSSFLTNLSWSGMKFTSNLSGSMVSFLIRVLQIRFVLIFLYRTLFPLVLQFRGFITIDQLIFVFTKTFSSFIYTNCIIFIGNGIKIV